MSLKRKHSNGDDDDDNALSSSSSSKKCSRVDLDILKCPICYEYPRNEVFQCSIGHSICSQCIEKLKNPRCPECLSSYTKEGGKTRNFLAERLLNSMNFDCPWKEMGCEKAGIKRQEMHVHENQCRYNPNGIKLCSLLGGLSSNCPYQVSPASLDDSVHVSALMDHLKKEHDIKTTTTFCDQVRNFKYYPAHFKQLTSLLLNGKEESTTPSSSGFLNYFREIYQLNDRSSGKQIGLYVILGRMDVVNSDVNLSWAFVRLTDENRHSSDVTIKVSLRSPSLAELPDVPELTWKGQQMDMITVKKLQLMNHEDRPKFKFSLPFTHICEHYVNSERYFIVEFSFVAN